ncbi:family 1 glycosylhydrolase [Dyadobacter sp. CY326]|uniref:family 1 glycosylhydrolase n=1 Tax=Dyadobacter sp. CY326 TaxID=2907300 RepID=UPI001F35906B|nr:family 1 glycosylhydrolase [Dyadobacter sp. CY326]MCE7067037.1 family 1 glycosylhydrolase [Dyadobacter sp. CY326]
METSNNTIEIWGGLECTINRVNDSYFDQLEYAGHYDRDGDIGLIASLGIKTLRYPVIWERHQPEPGAEIDWRCTETKLQQIRESGMTIIAGLVHHGSGPRHVNFFDGSFEEGLADYAAQVARKFPWISHYTPVNEPLTTARFCGLYGHWYPHFQDELSFYKILMSECKATVLAMRAIRKINPKAELIQTDDLGKSYGTPVLRYQTEHENERRWLSYELICGTLTPEHNMWKRMVEAGVDPEQLRYFQENNCKPAIAGFNYYMTSERHLDENLHKYDPKTHGGNGIHEYSDVEVARVRLDEPTGPGVLIREAWERLGLPMTITECHLYSTREEQMRWLKQMLETTALLRSEGVDIRAVTVWALLGLYGWNELVTQPWGVYEAGVFDVSNNQLRPTALAKMIEAHNAGLTFAHPVLGRKGWWQRDGRLLSSWRDDSLEPTPETESDCQPVLILDECGDFANAAREICQNRNIRFVTIGKAGGQQFSEMQIKRLDPWAVLHCPSEDTNQALQEQELRNLAEWCGKLGARYMIWKSQVDWSMCANALAVNPETLVLSASPQHTSQMLEEAFNMLLDGVAGLHDLEVETLMEHAS